MNDDDSKKKQQEHLRLFKNYFFVEDVLGRIQKDLEDLKKITNAEEKAQKANNFHSKHS